MTEQIEQIEQIEPVVWSRHWQPVGEADRLVFALLDDLPGWRARSAARISLSSALWSEREREILVEPPLREGPAAEFLKDAPRKAMLVLPVVDMPKVTSVNFSIEAAGKPGHRLPRGEICRMQARHFRYRAEQLNLGGLLDEELERLLATIFLFNPVELKEQLRKCSFLFDGDWRVACCTAKYVRKSIADCGSEAVAGARECRVRIKALVHGRVHVDETSSAQNPLLVLANYIRDGQCSGAEAGAVMRRLGVLLQEIALVRTPESERLLRRYFRYGSRWEMMARCRVPLDEPFLMRAKERREIHFGAVREHAASSLCRKWIWPTASTNITFHDARTNHFSVSVADNGVELHARKTRVVPDGEIGAVDEPDAEHRTAEQYTRYDAHEARADVIGIECRLRQPYLRRLTCRGVVIATLMAIAVLVRFGVFPSGGKPGLSSADVVTILIPVTVSASLLLARDTSTLAMHVKRVAQVSLMVSLGALWCLAVVLYLTGCVSIGSFG
ncbi:hypothetical protein CFP65_0307 [Kitasatospora sp. MMS16-BH015]|uniref:hypothetical protein n=1 Tax=Kitasatospora sp. MMS16-BH015 TaxID=2018025 RepID=UPI000CA386AE|nr:hypothetical protein [Kitasatospora sp. MMS16-BH015]AUG75281.1 hypothetical protein CFP65_0307 [Kitasatospora sp. MMS16-BH015]